MTVIKCACGNPTCKIKISIDDNLHVMITGKDGNDSLMYFNNVTRRELASGIYLDTISRVRELEAANAELKRLQADTAYQANTLGARLSDMEARAKSAESNNAELKRQVEHAETCKLSKRYDKLGYPYIDCSCGSTYIPDEIDYRRFSFCPFCGKKIEAQS